MCADECHDLRPRRLQSTRLLHNKVSRQHRRVRRHCESRLRNVTVVRMERLLGRLMLGLDCDEQRHALCLAHHCASCLWHWRAVRRLVALRALCKAGIEIRVVVTLLHSCLSHVINHDRRTQCIAALPIPGAACRASGNILFIPANILIVN